MNCIRGKKGRGPSVSRCWEAYKRYQKIRKSEKEKRLSIPITLAPLDYKVPYLTLPYLTCIST